MRRSGDFNVAFPDLDKQAVAYQTASSKGTFVGEKIIHDQFFVQASPYTMTGRGSIDLGSQKIDLQGVVSVALPAEQVIKKIPIVGAFYGGSIVGIPLRVSGALEHPEISYLSPADIGAELLNVPLRVLGIPLNAIRWFIPEGVN
jgi:hypothetical protein